jgi:hypothetical protein
MLLTEGKIVRFKGSRGEAEAMTFAAELQGRCKRDGASILITKATRLVPFFSINPVVSVTPEFSQSGLGSNGHQDAHRV